MPEKNSKASAELHPSQLKRFKQDAKKYKNLTGCTHAEALDYVVRERGFSNWRAVVAKAEKPGASQSLPQTFTSSALRLKAKGVGSGPVVLSSEATRLRVIRNRALLVKYGIEYSVFEPTATGLKKSILDSTQSVRTHLLLEKFHDFNAQSQGPESKVMKDAFLVFPDRLITTLVSLYRPNTKKGDPRMWFRKLGKFAVAGDQVAIVIMSDKAYLLNLSAYDLDLGVAHGNRVGDFILKFCRANNEVATELLGLLRELAKKPLKSVGYGDTTVGMTVEAALGVQANSSKLPDYKGIELKVARSSKNRSTLFAQVADWTRSACKSSAEILDRYGYERDKAFKLYCTVSAGKANSQGLKFIYDQTIDELQEVHESGDHVATWTGNLLRSRLLEKHAETFWVQVKSEIIDEIECFHLISVTHTKAPLLVQLMPLIDEGVITMDHLIKRTFGPRPRVSEKGPLFKIDKKNLGLLFPPPVIYSLTD
ncbi:MvaI/BcnI family restriction endonuclease [Marinagarivorans algicola]|uniref:MvaI/BcnI family restriction endonuclease n=1 Tax=Marinagarivorans algicola TaxID=1513270 RepID=UPI003736D354